ncbi:MAG: hypothetical protein D6747_07305 [Chlorobiota bacterium]|nr:MAG: hypothetical protein D6747_07305 [Chlorobiota bacterium]
MKRVLTISPQRREFYLYSTIVDEKVGITITYFFYSDAILLAESQDKLFTNFTNGSGGYTLNKPAKWTVLPQLYCTNMLLLKVSRYCDQYIVGLSTT